MIPDYLADPKLYEAFMANVDQQHKCWIWTGERFGPDGYGVFRVDKEHRYLAHRLLYRHTKKRWPKCPVTQTCGNKGCVKHLSE